MMVQMQKTLARIETQLTNLETNQREDNHRANRGHNRNQWDPHAVNVDRDLGVKLVISEYDGKLKQDEFMDWLVYIENIFVHKPMTDGHKVTLVATQFRNYAAIWWAEYVAKEKKKLNIDLVDTWIEMKNLLKQKFLLVNYSTDLRSSFQDLKQSSKTVIEYSEEFLTMQAHCGLNEDDDVLVDWYFHGLYIDIQHILTFKNLDNVDKIIQHAIKAEDIVNY